MDPAEPSKDVGRSDVGNLKLNSNSCRPSGRRWRAPEPIPPRSILKQINKIIIKISQDFFKYLLWEARALQKFCKFSWPHILASVDLASPTEWLFLSHQIATYFFSWTYSICPVTWYFFPTKCNGSNKRDEIEAVAPWSVLVGGVPLVFQAVPAIPFKVRDKLLNLEREW